jgi:hypothetical protein
VRGPSSQWRTVHEIVASDGAVGKSHMMRRQHAAQ